MKDDNRICRRQWIRRVVESYFEAKDGYNNCLTDDADVKVQEELHARFVEFLLDEKDSDLKDEAIYDMFLQVCESHSEPKEPTWDDVLFISKVTGRSPEQVKESMEREFRVREEE
jgi:hypothetical protein